MNTPLHSREVRAVITAHSQKEGAGFVVRRPLPSRGLPLADPFLLIDEMGPVDYAPGAARGAPDHPHRGFETVSYILEGELEHEDSAGHRGALSSGDVQWMTAGGGVIHSEMPSRNVRKNGGRVHGFQVWVNLPARLKMTRPRYQDVPSARIPTAQTADGTARVKVIAGEALGVRAVVETHTPVVFQDWTLEAGADVTLPLSPELTTLAYVFDGEAGVGPDARALRSGQLAVMGPGESIRLTGRPGTTGRVLLLAGAPHGEPVVHHGPFVMNTEAEIIQAIQDYQDGRMGEITRTAAHQ
jgi:redox-sensitive bicupin YhaK (pirin superfamily)